MQYSTGSHCVFDHRSHIVWSTKYRYKALQGVTRLRVRDICRQVGREKDVDIILACFPRIMSTCSCRFRRNLQSVIW